MPNPLTSFLSDRFIKPQVEAQVASVLKDARPYAVGAGFIPETSLGQAIGQPHDADYALLYALYKLNADVSGSVHKWAGGITGPGWHITTMDPLLQPGQALRAQMQELSRWLANPNPYKQMQLLLYEVVEHLAIVGDAFWYVSRDSQGRPLEIWGMHPALTRIVSNHQGEVLGYVMRVPGADAIAFPPEEVLHFRLPNPSNDLHGESPLELVVEEAGIDLQALRSNKAIFTNGLSPSALLLLDEQATPEQAKQLTDQITQRHQGVGNRHKLIALARVKDFKPYTLTPKDMESLGLRDLATSKVTTAFRLPKVILGHHNAGDYATTKFLIRETHQNTYRPVQQLIAQVITEGPIHAINPELRWEFHQPDSSDPDDLRKDQMRAVQLGILDADEVRPAFGKEPRPRTTSNNQLTDQEQADAAESAKAGATQKTHKSVSAEEIEAIKQRRESAMAELAEALQPKLVTYFENQEQRYLDRLTEAFGTSVSKHVTKGVVDDLVEDYLADPLPDDAELSTLFFVNLPDVISRGAEEAQLQISITLDIGVTQRIVDDYILTRSLLHARGINETTREARRQSLSQGIVEGEGIPELSARVQSTFAEAQGYRSTLIARTETAQAFESANQSALTASGVVESKQWLTAKDERLCPVCSPLEGVIVPLQDHFPGDLEPGAAHPACRCTSIGIIGPNRAE
ncbi:MAG: phage portal protein [Chloroflexota bacterium]|nr:phage portal protein [Chloroflexota bacterium]